MVPRNPSPLDGSGNPPHARVQAFLHVVFPDPHHAPTSPSKRGRGRRSNSLVEVIDVLGDDPDVIGPLQFHKSAMGGVGHGLTDGLAAFVVEVEDQPGIPPRRPRPSPAKKPDQPWRLARNADPPAVPFRLPASSKPSRSGPLVLLRLDLLDGAVRLLHGGSQPNAREVVPVELRRQLPC